MVHPEVKVSKVSFYIHNRLLNDFVMTMRLSAMNSTTYSVYGGTGSLDVNQYNKSY